MRRFDAARPAGGLVLTLHLEALRSLCQRKVPYELVFLDHPT